MTGGAGRRSARLRRAAIGLAAVVISYGSVAGLAEWRSAARSVPTDPDTLVGARSELLSVPVPTAPDDPTVLRLDAMLFVPDGVDATSPAPAVVLLHGFASDRTSQTQRAQQLVAQGYVVLAPSARGTGRSEGTITLADPDREGRDLRALVDLLATRDEVLRDAPDDPRVALVGASYGGGSALIAASSDARVDTVVAITAWHDLAASLAPNGVGRSGSGPLKVSWTSLLFTARSMPPDVDGSPSAGDVPGPPIGDGRCGRFAAHICALADRAAIDGRLDDEARTILRRARIDEFQHPTPVLLVQGRDDTLFGVDAAFANALVLDAAGAPVRIRLVAGGHAEVGAAASGGSLTREIDAWLDHWLRTPPELRSSPPPAAATGVLVHDADGTLSVTAWPVDPSTTGRQVLRGALPGLLAARVPSPPASGTSVATLVAPAGGLPAALTALPGIGAVADLVGLVGLGAIVDVPGQHLSLTTAPLEDGLLLLGAPSLSLGVASSTGTAQLFVRISTVAPGGRARIVGTSVAPVLLPDVSTDPARPTPVGIVLPDVLHRVAAGDRLRLTIATTDQAFANLREPGTVWLDVDELELTLQGPVQLDATTGAPLAQSVAASGLARLVRTAPVVVALPLLLVLIAATAGGLSIRTARRRQPLAPVTDRLAIAASGPDPIVIRGLVKEYPDGTRAVDGLDLRVEAGQVVGLLGPNGAGKTTTLRMLLGLIAPTAGEIELFGQPVRPGHPVLERVGALVEGPGLVPDLSGRDNLELFWRSGGRPLAEADLPWALSVADLGAAIDRPVRTYSHGMAQRLAIAQALLGRPELLVLDEPTDGLDPEQIRAMRRLLVRLGAEGHTVLVSSHLLSEVEQTCTHAVVVLGGRVVAAGPVSELGDSSRSLVVEVDDRSRAVTLLSDALGADRVALEGSGLVVTLDTPDESARIVTLLVTAGLEVRTATRRGRLEDVFLQLTTTDVRTDAPAVTA